MVLVNAIIPPLVNAYAAMPRPRIAAMEEMFAYFHELIAKRRATPNDDDDPLNTLIHFETLGGEHFDDG